MINELVSKLIDLDAFDRVIDRGSVLSGADGIFAKVRDAIGIRTNVVGTEPESIPRSGPLIVVANHPTGFAEGLAIPALLDSIRDDVFVLGHKFFERWPSLAERMVLVDPQARKTDAPAGGGAFFEAARRLRSGGCMVLFPAGSVARPAGLSLRAREGIWRSGLAKFVRLSDASILPVHVTGTTSLLYRTASRLHSRLGVPLLFREAMRSSRVPMTLTLHPLISADEFDGFGTSEVATERVRTILTSPITRTAALARPVTDRSVSSVGSSGPIHASPSGASPQNCTV